MGSMQDISLSIANRISEIKKHEVEMTDGYSKKSHPNLVDL